MKRLLFFKHILVALVAAMTIFSCVKREDVENLQSQIDALKSDQIASIESQIKAINSSITKLETTDKELKGYIETLQQKQSELQAKDEALDKSIADLKVEIYGKISEEKTALLQQMLGIQQDLQTQITNINTKILELEAKDKSLEEKDADLQTQINKLKEDLAKHVADYEQLVKDMATLEGTLRAEITAAQNAVLGQLDAYKTEVAGNLQVINNAITALQTKDENLQGQITELKTYVDTELQNTKDWATATFATLEQYNSVCSTVAGIQADITSINETIAALQTKVAQDKAELEGKISELDEKTAQALQSAVNQLNTTISNAKDEITAAYTSAIATAISGLESSLKTWVNNQLSGYYTISQVDELLTALQGTIDGKLSAQKVYLEGLINTLAGELSTRITANASKIVELEGKIKNPGSSEAALVETVIKNSVDIATNSQKISENSQSIASNTSAIAANKQAIEANQALISANATAIQSNKDAIEALQELYASANTAILENTTAISQNASNIAANASLISANATAITNNAKAISDNAADILKLQSDLATAKSDLTTAYTSAISEAVTTLNGKLSSAVSTINSRIDSEVSSIKSSITALQDRVTACENDIASIKDQISDIQDDLDDIHDILDAILARIQSIVVLPSYSDGSVKINSYGAYGTTDPYLTDICFEVTPRSASVALAKAPLSVFSLDAISTETKASVFTNIPVVKVADNGEVFIVTVDGSNLNEDFFRGKQSFNARLKIQDANNARTSEFFALCPVIFPTYGPDYIENGVNLGKSIIVIGDWKDNGKQTPLYWAPVNCGYEEVGEINTKNDHRLGKLYQWGAGDSSLPYKDNGRKYVAQAQYYSKGDFLDSSYGQMTGGTRTDKWNNNQGPCPEGWRLPTLNELKVLYNGRYNKGWIAAGTYAGQTDTYSGAEFFGSNYKSPGTGVFLPAAGRFEGNSGSSWVVFNGYGTNGFYWSSEPNIDSPNAANDIKFSSSSVEVSRDSRTYGYSVRCVSE